MKKAVYILNIISIVVAVISMITFAITCIGFGPILFSNVVKEEFAGIEYETGYTIMMVTLIATMIICYAFLTASLVIACKCNKKLKEVRTNKEMTTMAILTLIFVNMVSGILLLCMKDEDFLEDL